MKPSLGSALAVSWMLLHAADAAFAAEVALAVRAEGVLKAHCYRCHGRDGSAKGGFNYVLDRDKLVSRGKIVPSDAAQSELYQRVQDGEMPPPYKGAPPTKDERRILRQWIEAGAPSARLPGQAGRPFLSEQTVLGLDPRRTCKAAPSLVTGVSSATSPSFPWPTPVSPRSNSTGLTLTHCSPGCSTACPGTRASRPRCPLMRDGRCIASTCAITSGPRASGNGSKMPIPIPGVAAWATCVLPGRLPDIGCDLPVLRADWFVATAARPPLYHDLLQLPTTDRGLERLLQVDVPGDIQEETVARAGFNGSGVSKNNRLIERHDAAYGAYWRSYDFADNTGRHNVFEHPLGPLTGATSFEPAGGEIIFHLPNGLQAYLLVDGLGRRLERAPIEIVSDPKRPDQRVETGLSCMSCHARGLIPRADQVRAHVERNEQRL